MEQFVPLHPDGCWSPNAIFYNVYDPWVDNNTHLKFSIEGFHDEHYYLRLYYEE